MGITISRRFWPWEFDEEEQWLNKMAEDGKCLISVENNNYTFEDCEPGEYRIRVEFLKHSADNINSQNYISNMALEGAEFLGSRGKWVYFRKPYELGKFDWFSDTSPKMRHLKNQRFLVGAVMVVELLLAFSVLFKGMAQSIQILTFVAIALLLIGMLILIVVVQYTGAINFLKNEHKRVYGGK